MDLISFEMIVFIVLLASVSGFFAGLLGIGGGIILVPGLYYIFKTLGYDSAMLMHLAVGTSLAIIVPTGIASAISHFRKGNVRTDLLRMIGAGIIIGVINGTVIASFVDGEDLKLIFGFTLLVLAAFMIIPTERFQGQGNGPKGHKSLIAGTVVGTVSSLMGIGGAVMNVPFMTLNGVSIHRAVSTAATLGPVIALPAAVGFVLIGLDDRSLPPYSVGYVNFIALLVIAPISVLATIPGAWAAHKLPRGTLKLLFVGLMIFVSGKMIYSAFNDGIFAG